MRKLLSCIAAILIVICLFKVTFLAADNMVIRFDFTGLDNLFHPDHSYYAVIGSSSTYVPAWAVKLFYPDFDLEQSEYDDPDNDRYYASILYSPNGVTGVKTPVYDIGRGNEFVVTAHEWTKESAPMSPERIELLRNMIMDNYDFDDYFIDDDEGWVFKTGDRYGLDGFVMIMPKGVDDRAVLDADDRVCLIKKGRLSKIMNCPGRGRCGFVYFTDRW